MRRVCVWNGKRGGFGALAPTMDAIQQSPDLSLQLVVTDQHLYDRFGKTVTEVQARFPVSATIDMEQEGDSNRDRAGAIGRCLTKAAQVLGDLQPDILLVIGDRGEVFAACIAAHNMRVAIAHVQGGDISGSLDEPVRHAITKLAHIHFPSTQASADRIVAMGEEPWRVHVVGDTHIDQVFLGDITPADELRAKYDLSEEAPFMLVLQHSDSTVSHRAADQMAETVAAVVATGHRAMLVYPCSDQGFEGIISEIERVADSPGLSVHRNIPAADFIGLEKLAACIVGNSSAALIEAPYFGLPSVNIGERQKGRERAANVMDVDYDRDAIRTAIERCVSDEEFRQRLRDVQPPFGDGTAYRRITDVLATVVVDQNLLNKQMTY
tara:strand:- start:5880 stop:7022 length:1143 start_codon:yes stop_codon:yes gene_type:complete